MFHIDPRFVVIFLVLFFVMGAFNIYMGARRVKILRQHGYKAVWYKQVGYLTGIEYTLLGIVLLLNGGISTGIFPTSLAVIVVPAYIGVLILAALVLVVIFFQRITARRRLASRNNTSTTAPTHTTERQEMTPEQRAASTQRKRERRQKAAAARRRQTGRA